MINLKYCECGCHGSCTPYIGKTQLWLYTNLDPKRDYRCIEAFVSETHDGYGKILAKFNSTNLQVDNALEARKYITKIMFEEIQKEITRLMNLLTTLQIDS